MRFLSLLLALIHLLDLGRVDKKDTDGSDGDSKMGVSVLDSDGDTTMGSAGAGDSSMDTSAN